MIKGQDIIYLWIAIPQRGRALHHGFCAGCWFVWRFIHRTAICATKYISVALLRSTPPPIIRFPLHMTSATVCAPAASFKRVHQSLLF